MDVKPVGNIGFKGIPLSKVKIITPNGQTARYTVYKALHGDEPFLEEISLNTNVMNRVKGLTDIEYTIWDSILGEGLTQLLGSNKFTLLLADKNKCACGFLNYKQMPDKFSVEYVSTWPNKEGERGLLAGKTLFMELFNIFKQDTERKSIILEALTCAPFSPISKYMELGFRSFGGQNFQEYMRISRNGILKSLDKYKNMILRKEIKNPVEVDFNNTLHIVTG